MKIFHYKIQLIDPIFFAREGISGAFTPPYIHATAINHSVIWAKGKESESQLYIISDTLDKHRNIPRYESSRITDDFYFTPARQTTNYGYYSEIVKGDGDKSIQVGYGKTKMKTPDSPKEQKIKRRFHNEILKAYRIHSIPPETILEGYLYTKLDKEEFPRLIRLGSFRGLAKLEIEECKVLHPDKNKSCKHPVDPLVQRPIKGILIPMLPYPIVENPVIEDVWLIKSKNYETYIAAFSDITNQTPEASKGGIEII